MENNKARRDETLGHPGGRSAPLSSARGLVYASLLGALTATGAYVLIPLPFVPLTLQTFFVYLAGALLGSRLGSLSQAVYVALGILGLPVFSGGKAGLGVLLGPTGGYLFGFIAGAWIVGKLTERGRNAGRARLLLAMAAGAAVLFLMGVGQLMVVARLSLVQAWAVGVLPALPGEAVKLAAAALLCPVLRRRIRPGP